LSSVTFIDDDWLEGNYTTLVTDDIIISRSGTVGITFVWNENEINGILIVKLQQYFRLFNS